MTVFAEDVELRLENSCDRAHQDTTLTGEVGKNFLPEVRLEQISRADADPQ